jgi:hypothetical protein
VRRLSDSGSRAKAGRERLVVSYARRGTGESRPHLPSIFFREVASQLEDRRVSADEAPLLRRSDLERIPSDAIGAPIPGGRYASDRKVVSKLPRVPFPRSTATGPSSRRTSRGR